MIEVSDFSREEIRRAYDARSGIYSRIVAPREKRFHRTAIEKARIFPGQSVLEVAVGLGMTLRELAGRAGGKTTIFGTDLQSKMLGLAQQSMHAAGSPNSELGQANCS